MDAPERLSPWWKHSVILTVVAGFTILIWLAAKSYRDAPPIPERVLSPSGETVFTAQDVLKGQQVFLKYGLMENGTIWGHGAYLGPDFSAASCSIRSPIRWARRKSNGVPSTERSSPVSLIS